MKIIKDTNMKNYGVDHNMKIKKEHIKDGKPTPHEKAVQTCEKNNGYKHAINTPENRLKGAKVFFDNWGYTFGNVPEIREKMKKTNIEKLGYEYPLQNKEIHEKVKKTTKERYGKEYYVQTDAFFALMIERYGVKHAMQNPILFEKAMKTAYAQKPYKYPSGNTIYIQGYEWMCIDYLQKHENLTEEDIVTGVTQVPEVKYEFEEIRHYYMDIYIPSQDKAIEVKSDYTYSFEAQIKKNTAKWLECSKKFKGGIDIYVFGKKGLLFRQTLKDCKIIDEIIVKDCKEYGCYSFER